MVQGFGHWMLSSFLCLTFMTFFANNVMALIQGSYNYQCYLWGFLLRLIVECTPKHYSNYYYKAPVLSANLGFERRKFDSGAVQSDHPFFGRPQACAAFFWLNLYMGGCQN